MTAASRQTTHSEANKMATIREMAEAAYDAVEFLYENGGYVDAPADDENAVGLRDALETIRDIIDEPGGES